MDIYKDIDLQDCPYCDGAAMLEEENGWCWYGSNSQGFQKKSYSCSPTHYIVKWSLCWSQYKTREERIPILEFVYSYCLKMD